MSSPSESILAPSLLTDTQIRTALASPDPLFALRTILSSTNINQSLGFTGTPLTVALHENASPALIEFLLSLGASSNLGASGDTPLVVAARYSDPVVVGLLVDNGAEVKGNRALHQAAWLGRVEVVKALLESGASADEIVEDEGVSYQEKEEGIGGALHAVAGVKGGMVSEKDQVYTVRMLLEKGANRDLKDTKGRTPVEVARKAGAKKVVRVLEGEDGGGGERKGGFLAQLGKRIRGA